MTRDDIYDQDRGEREKYLEVEDYDAPIHLPLTKDGFETLLEVAAGIYDLPTDDAMRQVLAGYVHHIPNEENTTTLNTLSRIMYKSVSNSTTWRIDQETKLKIKDEARKLAEELANKDKEPADVVPIKK